MKIKIKPGRKKMKNQRTNHQNKTKMEEYIPNFSFMWVYSANGLVSQGHNEDDYISYISSNYTGKSNQDF
jgi:hypothetical protein